MRDLNKYKGVIPAFYACYDKEGNVSPEGVQALTQYFVEKGVKGLYVNGSSGECIYQSVEDRKMILENVMKAAKGKLTIIAHVACNNTKDSMELARHAQSQGVDAIAAIPPIYFRLPEHAMPVQDIQMFKQASGEDYIIFNGPDEQFISGLAIGAEGGIGGTYGAMPELFLKLEEYVKSNEMAKARELQYTVNEIIYKLCSAKGNMYGVIKEVLKLNEGLELGGVRAPLPSLADSDMAVVEEAAQMIRSARESYIA